MFDQFEFSQLGYFMILVLIPGIVESAKKIQWVATGNRPFAVGLGLGVFFVGFAEAVALDLVPAGVLPWVRVVVMGLAGGLAATGYFDLTKPIRSK